MLNAVLMVVSIGIPFKLVSNCISLFSSALSISTVNSIFYFDLIDTGCRPRILWRHFSSSHGVSWRLFASDSSQSKWVGKNSLGFFHECIVIFQYLSGSHYMHLSLFLYIHQCSSLCCLSQSRFPAMWFPLQWKQSACSEVHWSLLCLTVEHFLQTLLFLHHFVACPYAWQLLHSIGLALNLWTLVSYLSTAMYTLNGSLSSLKVTINALIWRICCLYKICRLYIDHTVFILHVFFEFIDIFDVWLIDIDAFWEV